METKKKQDNWYAIIDGMGRHTNNYVFASNITEARKKFKTDPQYAELYKKYGYFGSLKRVYNGGVRG